MARSINVQLATDQFPSVEENAALDLQSVCVCNLFKRLTAEHGLSLPKPLVGIVGSFKDEPARVSDVLGRVIVRSETDVKDFATADDDAKRRIAAKLVQEVVEAACVHVNMQAEMFAPVFAQMADLDYVNRFLWKRKQTPDRKASVEVWIEYLPHSIEITARRVMKTDGEVVWRKVNSIPVNEFAIHELLGDIRFDDQGQAFIESRRGVRHVVDLK